MSRTYRINPDTRTPIDPLAQAKAAGHPSREWKQFAASRLDQRRKLNGRSKADH
jgi:hypothetical protein